MFHAMESSAITHVTKEVYIMPIYALLCRIILLGMTEVSTYYDTSGNGSPRVYAFVLVTLSGEMAQGAKAGPMQFNPLFTSFPTLICECCLIKHNVADQPGGMRIGTNMILRITTGTWNKKYLLGTDRWFGARLQHFQCVSNGNTAILHYVIEII